MHATTARVLGTEQLAAFHRNGFLIARNLFSLGEVAELRDTFMEASGMGPVEGLWAPDKNSSDPLARYPRMMHPHKQKHLPIGALAQRVALDARVGAILTDLMDEEPICAQSMFYFKPSGARGQSLHQDNFYLRVSPGTCTAAWLAVDKCDRENGGLVVVPGTQNDPIVCPQKADSSLFFTSDYVPPPEGSLEIPCDMEPGDMLFFNGSIIHGSYPNVSKDRFRRSFICHYAPASSTAVGQWYRPLLRFNGQEVAMPDAPGSGPCGGAEDKGPH
jgi:ectoine hydroxylase-related dioxygenase (phytanoyl-CoA dioxygenase family)